MNIGGKQLGCWYICWYIMITKNKYHVTARLARHFSTDTLPPINCFTPSKAVHETRVNPCDARVLCFMPFFPAYYNRGGILLVFAKKNIGLTTGASGILNVCVSLSSGCRLEKMENLTSILWSATLNHCLTALGFSKSMVDNGALKLQMGMSRINLIVACA